MKFMHGNFTISVLYLWCSPDHPGEFLGGTLK